MKRKQIVTVMAMAFFAAVVVAAPLAAAPGCGGPGCPEEVEAKAKGCGMEQGCMMLQKLPNLSAEQRTKQETMHAEQKQAMAVAKAAWEKLAGEMQALLQEPVDVKKAEAKIDELAEFRAAMQKKHLAHFLAVRALLTDEQKAKVPAMAGCLTGGGMAGTMAGGCGHMAKTAGCGKGERKKECCSKDEMKKEGWGMKHGQEQAGCAARPECQKEAEPKTP